MNQRGAAITFSTVLAIALGILCYGVYQIDDAVVTIILGSILALTSLALIIGITSVSGDDE